MKTTDQTAEEYKSRINSALHYLGNRERLDFVEVGQLEDILRGVKPKPKCECQH